MLLRERTRVRMLIHMPYKRIYYDEEAKAWTLEQETLHGKIVREEWIRAPEYDKRTKKKTR